MAQAVEARKEAANLWMSVGPVPIQWSVMTELFTATTATSVVKLSATGGVYASYHARYGMRWSATRPGQPGIWKEFSDFT